MSHFDFNTNIGGFTVSSLSTKLGEAVLLNHTPVWIIDHSQLGPLLFFFQISVVKHTCMYILISCLFPSQLL